MSRRVRNGCLLLPLLVVMAVFLAGLADSILQGFGVLPAVGLTTPTTAYYREVLASPDLRESIRISLGVALVSALLSVLLAVPLSHALVSLRKTAGISYLILKLPMLIPWMVTGVLMTGLLSGSGWLARVFFALGRERAAAVFAGVLHQPHHLGVILAFVWGCTPFCCFFIVTRMQQLQHTLVEAGQVLGAGNRQSFWHITLPLSLPVIRHMFLIVLLSCFGSYEIPLLLGMTTPRALAVEIYHQYNHFDLAHRPYTMALNTVMIVCALLLATAVWGITRLYRWLRHRGKQGAA